MDSDDLEVATLWAERGSGGTESLSLELAGLHLSVLIGGGTRICARDPRVNAGRDILFEVNYSAEGLTFGVEGRAYASFGLAGDPGFSLGVFAAKVGQGPGWVLSSNENSELTLFRIEESGAHRTKFDSRTP